MFNKKLYMILILLLLLFLFFSCNNKELENTIDTKLSQKNSESTKESNIEKTTIIINSYISDSLSEKAFNELTNNFMRDNPQIEIVINTLNIEDVESSIESWLSSDSPPDIITWYAGERLRYYAEKGLISPLKDILHGGFENYFPIVFKNSCSYNKNIYLLPQSWNWWIIYYRKSVFEKYNIKIPQTWDEFINTNIQLKLAGLNPLIVGTKDIISPTIIFDYLNLRINGINFHKKLLSGKNEYLDDKINRTIEYFNTLIKNKFLIIRNDYTSKDVVKLLLTEDAGMCLSIADIDALVKDPKIKNDIDFFKFPIINQNKNNNCEICHIDGFIIPSKTKNKTEAEEFLKYISTKESQEFFANKTGKNAANKKITFIDTHSEKMMDTILLSDGVMQDYREGTKPTFYEKGQMAFAKYIESPDTIENILFNLEKERRQVYEQGDVSNFINGNITLYLNLSEAKAKNVFTHLIETFKEQNPYIEISIIFDDSQNFTSNLEKLIKSNNSPDIILLKTGEKFKSFAENNLISPIDDLFNEDFNNYFPDKFKSISSHNNKLYLVPLSFKWWVLYYKKSIFKKHSIELPRNWDDFINVCELLKLRRYTPIAIGTKDAFTIARWFDYLNLKINGIDFYNDYINSKIPYTDERILNVFAYLKQMVKDSYFIKDHKQYNQNDAFDLLINGKVGLFLSESDIIDTIKIPRLKNNIDFFRFPEINETSKINEMSEVLGFIMSSKSVYPDATKLFLKFLATEKAQKHIFLKLEIPVVNKDVNNSRNFSKKELNIIQNSEGITQLYSGEYKSEIAKLTANKLIEFINSQKKIETIIEELEKERKKNLEG